MLTRSLTAVYLSFCQFIAIYQVRVLFKLSLTAHDFRANDYLSYFRTAILDRTLKGKGSSYRTNIYVSIIPILVGSE